MWTDGLRMTSEAIDSPREIVPLQEGRAVGKRRPRHAEIQGWYCPLPPRVIVERRLVTGRFKFTPDGLQMRCSKCREYWPFDTEFFFASKTPEGAFHWCRACYCEYRWPERYGLAPRRQAAA